LISPKKRFEDTKITPGPGEYSPADFKKRPSSALITRAKKKTKKDLSPAPG